MGESLGKTDRSIYFEQDVGDPHGWHPAIEIEYQFVGAVRNISRQPVDPQRAILDAATRDGSVTRCACQPLQTIGEPSLAISQSKLRIKGNGESGVRLCCGQWHQDLLQIAIAARMIEPDVTGSESITQVKQDRHFPKTIVSLVLGSKMPVPFRIRPQESFGCRGRRSHFPDGFRCHHQRLSHRRRLEFQAPQHARRIAAEAMISLSDMGKRLIGQRIAELNAGRDQLFETIPFRRFGDRHFQRQTIVAGFEECGSQSCEGA